MNSASSQKTAESVSKLQEPELKINRQVNQLSKNYFEDFEENQKPKHLNEDFKHCFNQVCMYSYS